jgi:ABC-2 type transport system ATP-binding protein
MEKEDAPVIETEELTKTYGNQVAVDHLSFSIARGEVFGFLGPNGAGKTTTLLMLLGLTEPSGGRARVAGLDPVRRPIEVKRIVGYLQENMGFYRDLDAWQMLRFIAQLNNIDGGQVGERIETALQSVGLLEQGKKKIEAYSRGMRQRLGLAEILLKEPAIAFLDEPTLGLDPEGTNQVLELIGRFSREKRMTVLLSSHQLYQVQRICTRVGIMFHGRLVAHGSMEQLAQDRLGELGAGQKEYSLEEIYMKYFREAEAWAASAAESGRS